MSCEFGLILSQRTGKTLHPRLLALLGDPTITFCGCVLMVRSAGVSMKIASRKVKLLIKKTRATARSRNVAPRTQRASCVESSVTGVGLQSKARCTAAQLHHAHELTQLLSSRDAEGFRMSHVRGSRLRVGTQNAGALRVAWALRGAPANRAASKAPAVDFCVASGWLVE